MKAIEELQAIFTVVDLCSLLGVARSTYYRWKKKDWDSKDEIEQRIIDLCTRHKFRYGYRRITATLSKQLPQKVNHKKVLRIMKKHKVLSKVRKKKKVFLTGSDPVIAENLIQRNFKAIQPNQKWFTDISYIPFGNQMLYFSSIIDAFNNEVISHNVSTKQDLSLALTTLEEACARKNVSQTILHTDQGGLYTSKHFQRVANEKGIITSMSRKGNCHDNAAIESFHSHLKSEVFYSQNIKHTSNETVLEIINDYIHYYNYERIQEKLKYLSPIEYREQVC